MNGVRVCIGLWSNGEGNSVAKRSSDQPTASLVDALFADKPVYGNP
jgi:hypothetical protein